MGGTWGDITESIVNNGQTLHPLLKKRLKNYDNTFSKNERKYFKNLILDSNMTAVSGHIKEPLNWQLKNYVIVVDDPEVIKAAVYRFYKLYNEATVDHVISLYFTEKLSNKIKNLSIENKLSLLEKKYTSFLLDKSLPQNITKINLNNIYDKNEYLKNLQEYFVFNIDYAGLLYDIWYNEEKNIIPDA